MQNIAADPEASWVCFFSFTAFVLCAGQYHKTGSLDLNISKINIYLQHEQAEKIV